jgi:hypothetical protein
MTFNAFRNITLSFAIATFGFVSLASGADKTFTENEFLNNFSGKSKKAVLELLGNPVKKQASVKPTNAEKITGKNFKDDKKSSQVKIEMWYYNSIVKYDPTHAYKEVEITFVNDYVGNIAFFNNR